MHSRPSVGMRFDFLLHGLVDLRFPHGATGARRCPESRSDAGGLCNSITARRTRRVIFIPPHLVEEVLERADYIHIKDEWTKAKLLTGKWRASQLYGGKLTPELQKEFDDFKRKRMAEIKAGRGEK